MGTLKVNLKTPLTTHRGQVSTLEFKSPKARLFIENGEPFTMRFVDDRTLFDFNNKVCAAFLADMCGVDAALLEDMTAIDWISCRNGLVNLTLGILGEDHTPPLAA